jgi:hypothetical protein
MKRDDPATISAASRRRELALDGGPARARRGQRPVIAVAGHESRFLMEGRCRVDGSVAGRSVRELIAATVLSPPVCWLSVPAGCDLAGRAVVSPVRAVVPRRW